MLRIIILLLAPFLSYSQILPKVFIKDSFEESDFMNNWYLEESCCEYSITRSDSVARDGTHSLKAYVIKGTAVRAEIRALSDPTLFIDRWYRISHYFPVNGYAIDSGYAITGQWHDTPDPGETEPRSPNLAIQIFKKRLTIVTRWDADPINSNEDLDGQATYDIEDLQLGVWYDFVFHVRFSYMNDGILEVWMKKGTQPAYTKIVNRINQPNCYNDLRGPYFKIGLYKPDFASSFLNSLTVFLDAVDVTS